MSTHSPVWNISDQPAVRSRAPQKARSQRRSRRKALRSAAVDGPTDHLPALTALRFPAVLMLVIASCVGLFGLNSLPWQLSQAFAFFFVLSGFVLAYRHPKIRPSGAAQFYRDRMAKIWPLHLFTLALALLLNPAVRAAATPYATVSNLLLVNEWIQYSGEWDDVTVALHRAAWTLSTLWALYLLFPLWGKSFYRTWQIKLGVSFLLVVVVIWACDHTFLREASVTVGPYAQSEWVYKHFTARLFEFTLGMTAATFFRRTRERWQPSRATATLLEVAALLAILLAATVISRGLAVATFGEPSTSWGLVTWFAQGGVTSAFFAALLFVFASGRGWLARLLSGRFPVMLGQISFAMYMLHDLFVDYYRVHAQTFASVPDLALFGALLGLLVLASHVVWALVEQPARRWLIDTSANPPDHRGRNALPRRAPQSSGPYAQLSPQSIALLMQPKPPRFGNLFNPGRILIVCEVAVLLVLTVAWVWMGHARPKLTADDKTATDAIVAASRPGTRNVTFGDQFLLLGIQILDHSDGVQVRAVWQSLKDQNLDYTLQLQLLAKPDGEPLLRGGYPQDFAHRHVTQGEIWENRGFVPKVRLEGVNLIGIGLNRPGDTLIIHNGRTDSDRKRLLIPLQPDDKQPTPAKKPTIALKPPKAPKATTAPKPTTQPRANVR